jgi:hypothetical protein
LERRELVRHSRGFALCTSSLLVGSIRATSVFWVWFECEKHTKGKQNEQHSFVNIGAQNFILDGVMYFSFNILVIIDENIIEKNTLWETKWSTS